MKNFFKKTTLIPILFAMLIYSPLITSHATHLETQTKRQSLQKGSVVQDQHVFAIPDNGWNVVDIELDYYESYYSSTNTQNAFPFRQKFYMIKRSGAGANNISVDVSNALHTDGTNKVIISPFQQGDLLVDTSKWEWGVSHSQLLFHFLLHCFFFLAFCSSFRIVSQKVKYFTDLIISNYENFTIHVHFPSVYAA